MGIQYSGGTYVNGTFMVASRADIVSNIIGSLTTAGWTAGTLGTMSSVVTPQGLQCVARVYDPGSGTCARIRLTDTQGIDHFLDPANTPFQIQASQYQFFVSVPGNFNVGRSFVAVGTPFIESFLTSRITSAYWSAANSASDNDTSNRTCFRYINIAGQVTETRHSLAVVNGNGDFAGVESLKLIMEFGAQGSGQDEVGVLWHGDVATKIPTRMSWGIINETWGRIRGQMWDSVIIMNPYAGDLTTTFDGHNWINLMHNFHLCSLWIATS